MKKNNWIIKKGLLLLILLEVSERLYAYNSINKRLIFPIKEYTFVYLRDTSNIYSLSDSTKNKLLYKNSIFFELGGAGVVYSLNFEKGLISYKNYLFTIRGGIIYFPIMESFVVAFPIILNNQLKISRKISFEAGIGCTLTGFSINYLVINSGFKFGNKFFFKIDFTPIFEKDYNIKNTYKWHFQPWVGLSVGFNFTRR